MGVRDGLSKRMHTYMNLYISFGHFPDKYNMIPYSRRNLYTLKPYISFIYLAALSIKLSKIFTGRNITFICT